MITVLKAPTPKGEGRLVGILSCAQGQIQEGGDGDQTVSVRRHILHIPDVSGDPAAVFDCYPAADHLAHLHGGGDCVGQHHLSGSDFPSAGE